MSKEQSDEKPIYQDARGSQGNVTQVGRDNIKQTSVSILMPIVLLLVLGGLGYLMFFGKNQGYIQPNLNPTQPTNQK